MLSTASDLRNHLEAVLENRIPRAFTPPQRTAPETIFTGIASVDALTGGIPIGCLTEMCGAASSGRTSVLMALINACICRSEVCALVDTSDAFDPHSAANAGVELGKLLWVRGGGEKGNRQSAVGTRPVNTLESQKLEPKLDKSRQQRALHPSRFSKKNPEPLLAECRVPNAECPSLEASLKATDLLLQAGGFGLVVLDLADIPVSAARRIPLTTWFRFRRAVENTSTALVVLEEQPNAKSCASLVMEFSAQQANWSTANDPGDSRNGITPACSGLGDVTFGVTSEGIAVPFDRPTSSFEAPQRWNSPRLLDSVHVHLQVTRARGLREAQKFPAQSERIKIFQQEQERNTKDTKDTKVMSLVN